MKEDLLIIKLRDCFTAGYTLPQFCIDNGIKKPLFVALDERRVDFLWEIFVQFKYAKRISPTFTLLNGKSGALNFSTAYILSALQFENVSSINFAEYDKIIVLSNIIFNQKLSTLIYLEELTDYFITRAYAEIPLLHFIQQHPHVKLIVTNFPNQPKIDDENFNQLLNVTALRNKIKTNNSEKDIPTLLDKLGYNNEEFYTLTSTPIIEQKLDGSTYMKDDDNPLISIKNSKRTTAYQPQYYINKIHLLGGCHIFGINAPFDKNIASYLQKQLNENNFAYRVENESQFFGDRMQDIFYTLKNLELKLGDIIIVEISHIKPVSLLPVLDVSNAFDSYDYRELWAFQYHSNEIGYKILAEKYFQFLTQNNFFKDVDFHYPPPPPPPHRYGIPRENFSSVTKFLDNKELEAHKQKLREKRVKIGCIVMNANPFTLGHEYLVQYAAARVHKLFVMVVSEDKSEFTFEDRFEMVKYGTEQFPNVEVLPSGQFVISRKTFSGYFNKENLQDVQVDSSQDVEIFAGEIAPSLGINIRFVGEEPEDTVTRQYNDSMKNILPRYDIDFCEIPRREIDGQVISAKTVRAALKAGDLETLKKLVPVTTFEYLREKFKFA